MTSARRYKQERVKKVRTNEQEKWHESLGRQLWEVELVTQAPNYADVLKYRRGVHLG